MTGQEHLLTRLPDSASVCLPEKHSSLRFPAAAEIQASSPETAAGQCASREVWEPPEAAWHRVEGIPNFIAASPVLRQVLSRIIRAGASHSPVLITGESGTGKELLARFVHLHSERRHQRLVVFNCVGLVREMAESQLFGHRRGSFTGAISDYPGLIRGAEGGTLFLDEIGELGLEHQPRLLRFLQEGEVLPLGATEPVRASVRLIAATNRHPEAEVEAGRFRADLYYRLNAIRIHLPPLRERREEIPWLIAHYLDYYCRQSGRRRLTLSREAVNRLMAYGWPGNVRELCYEIERLVLFADDGEIIRPGHLSPAITQAAESHAATPEPLIDDALTLAENLNRMEKRMIERTLARHSGNLSQTARALGMTRTGLRKAIARLITSPARQAQAVCTGGD